VDTELNRSGRKRRIVLRCQHYVAACRVVGETNMLLTIPEHYAQMLNAGFDHRLYPFPLKSLQQLEIQMYWHESAENDPPNRWLREQIKNVVDGIFLEPAPETRSRVRRSEKPRSRPQLIRRNQ
jgi:DNA-binding transcriptional LysR family regulator